MSIDLLFQPTPGMDIHTAAKLTLDARQFDERISGFVFNGVIVTIYDETEPGPLVDKYFQKMNRQAKGVGP